MYTYIDPIAIVVDPFLGGYIGMAG